MEENWIENTGEMPVSGHTKVDFVFDDGEVREGDPANYWYWGLDGGITHWRLHQELNEGGYVQWSGGECPVSEDTVVDYKLRNGDVFQESAGALRWDHRQWKTDIVAYMVVCKDTPKLSVPYAPNMFIEVPEVENKPEVKDTNPKDMVGTRKAPLSTVPMNVIAEVGVAMLEGAAKYGRHNYRAVGVRASVYFDATMRHLLSWWEYEDIDPDSQINHITKAITSLVVLRDAMMQGKCTDDRPPRSKPFYGVLNTLAGEIIDKHSDKAPKHYTIEEV